MADAISRACRALKAISRHIRDDEHAVLTVALHFLSGTFALFLQREGTGLVGFATTTVTSLPRAFEIILIRNPVRKQVVSVAGNSVPARFLCVHGL